MGGYGGSVGARGFYQLPILQSDNGALHRAFGQTGFIGQHAQTGFDRSPVLAGGAPGKIKINEKGSRLLIMPHDIAHEDVEHVVIDWHRSVETRHGERLKGLHCYKLKTEGIHAIPINGQHFSRGKAA